MTFVLNLHIHVQSSFEKSVDLEQLKKSGDQDPPSVNLMYNAWNHAL